MLLKLSVRWCPLAERLGTSQGKEHNINKRSYAVSRRFLLVRLWSEKGSYYNQGKGINEHDYQKGQYYNEYYDNDLDLITHDKSSGSESHNESMPQENNIKYL